MTVAEAFLRGERDGTRYRLVAGRTPPPGREGPVASRRAGSSLEFHDHRDYEPGDDLRFVDWQAFARSERLVVKRHREEVAPHVDLLVDGSRSMGAPFPQKASAAAFVAGLLAGAARATGLSVTTWLLGDRPARVAAPGRRAARHAEGAHLAFEGTASLAAVLAAAPPALRPRGVRLLVTDFLFPEDPALVLRPLARDAAFAGVVEILAQEDLDPLARGPVSLVDVETGARRDVLFGETERERYREALDRHRALVADVARRHGVTRVPLVAPESPSAPLLRHGVLVARG